MPLTGTQKPAAKAHGLSASRAAEALLGAALARLPHAREFRFLDRLISLEPGKSGIGEYRVRGDEPFMRGHFPGDPLFPGVLLVEAAAQLAGTVAQSDPEIPALLRLKLTAMRAIKIRGTAKPGDAIELRARVTGRFGNLVHAETSASVNGVVVMQGEVTLGGEPIQWDGAPGDNGSGL